MYLQGPAGRQTWPSRRSRGGSLHLSPSHLPALGIWKLIGCGRCRFPELQDEWKRLGRSAFSISGFFQEPEKVLVAELLLHDVVVGTIIITIVINNC